MRVWSTKGFHNWHGAPIGEEYKARNRKWTEEQIKAVRRLLRKGDVPGVAISIQTGVPHQTVSAIKNGRAYVGVYLLDE